jgi:hypothetical protein
MALGPLVFTSMGVLGTVVYLLSSDRRDKKSNKFFFLYLASIFSVWISFEILETVERGSSIRILVAPLLLLGIYGFLFFGVMLFGSILKDKKTTGINEDNVVNSTENVEVKIDQTIYADQFNLHAVNTKKNKIWYVVKDKIYDKFQSYNGYYFDKSLDGKRYTTFKKNDELFGFTINDVNVDVIEYRDGKAIVECPSCEQKCRCVALDHVEVKCPSCGQNWNQKFDTDLAKSSV